MLQTHPVEVRSMTGVAIELSVLLLLQTVGTSLFARFEVETPAWRKLFKWGALIGITVALYRFVGHWALCCPLSIFALGTAVHFIWCARNGIDPLWATPRRR